MEFKDFQIHLRILTRHVFSKVPAHPVDTDNNISSMKSPRELWSLRTMVLYC